MENKVIKMKEPFNDAWAEFMNHIQNGSGAIDLVWGPAEEPIPAQFTKDLIPKMKILARQGKLI